MLQPVPDVSQGQPGATSGTRHRRLSIARIGVLSFSLASILMLGVAGMATYRWLDSNLFHWGLADSKPTSVNQAELLQKVHAFELVTVKNTYQSQSHRSISDILNAGSIHVTLPGWLAGQQLAVKGRVTVTAGVDLSQVTQGDMDVSRRGKDLRVLIRIPAAQVTSTELVPNSLTMSSSAGMLTNLGLALGMNEKDLRNRAADEVMRTARETALRQGIREDAAGEAERRLQAFLQSLPQNGSGHITYTVIARQPEPAPTL